MFVLSSLLGILLLFYFLKGAVSQVFPWFLPIWAPYSHAYGFNFAGIFAYAKNYKISLTTWSLSDFFFIFSVIFIMGPDGFDSWKKPKKTCYTATLNTNFNSSPKSAIFLKFVKFDPSYCRKYEIKRKRFCRCFREG